LRTCYFDCFSGASGDMLLGSLLDAGLAIEELQAGLDLLELEGYRLATGKVTRHGLTGTCLQVLVQGDGHPTRTLPAIERILNTRRLSEQVRAQSLRVFRRLANAEAAVHAVPVDQVHFHEIGAVDSLVDIVGFALALERLGIEAVYCSPLPVGGGMVRTEHGLLPVPAPATLALLAQAGAPTVGGPGQAELVTPTGAALLTELAAFGQPEMAIRAVGYGFGTKEFAWPNALRAWIGDAPGEPTSEATDQVVEVACNLDDTTGQVLGYLLERLLAAGALDAWFTPIQMKKNRPATQLSVLARPEDAEALAVLVLRETTTLGVRYRRFSRHKAGRELLATATPWGPVRVKAKILQGKVIALAPEYDDCARLATAAGVPLIEVMEAARQAARQITG